MHFDKFKLSLKSLENYLTGYFEPLKTPVEVFNGQIFSFFNMVQTEKCPINCSKYLGILLGIFVTFWALWCLWGMADHL